MKKLVALLAIIFVGISLSACQSSGSGSDAKSSSSAPTASVAPAAPTKEAPVSLNGVWKADGFEAVVDSSSIKISIVSADSTSLYWKGTFASGADKITSIGDREALDASMLGSQDANKVFNIDGEKITFKISMMGTTKMIKLEKI